MLPEGAASRRPMPNGLRGGGLLDRPEPQADQAHRSGHDGDGDAA